METKPMEQLARHEDRQELKAALEARRELGPEMEDHVLEAFLTRIQGQVDSQLARRAPHGKSKPVSSMKGEPVQVEIVASTFALAIPLMAIAQITARGAGVLFVMLGVIVVNLLYFIDRWIRMH